MLRPFVRALRELKEAVVYVTICFTLPRRQLLRGEPALVGRIQMTHRLRNEDCNPRFHTA